MRKRRGQLLEETELRDYALRLLAARALTVAQLKQRLRPRAADPASVERIVTQLREYGALDDRRFADSFSSARAASGQFGRTRVLAELLNRKVAPKVAEQAVRRAFEGLDEDRMAAEWLERKYRNQDLVAVLAQPARLAAAYRRLRHAGFSSGAAIRALKRYSGQADRLEELEEAPPAD